MVAGSANRTLLTLIVFISLSFLGLLLQRVLQRV